MQCWLSLTYRDAMFPSISSKSMAKSEVLLQTPRSSEAYFLIRICPTLKCPEPFETPDWPFWPALSNLPAQRRNISWISRVSRNLTNWNRTRSRSLRTWLTWSKRLAQIWSFVNGVLTMKQIIYLCRMSCQPFDGSEVLRLRYRIFLHFIMDKLLTGMNSWLRLLHKVALYLVLKIWRKRSLGKLASFAKYLLVQLATRCLS